MIGAWLAGRITERVEAWVEQTRQALALAARIEQAQVRGRALGLTRDEIDRGICDALTDHRTGDDDLET